MSSSKEEIEAVVNKIMFERNINIEYFNNNSVVKVSSEEITLIGPTEEFDKAMVEVTSDYIDKNKYKQ